MKDESGIFPTEAAKDVVDLIEVVVDRWHVVESAGSQPRTSNAQMADHKRA